MFRDETGMIPEDVFLNMVHFGDHEGERSNLFGFANIPGSRLGSTLIHIDNQYVPVRDIEGNVVFSNHRVPTSPLDELLERNEEVVCWNQPTTRAQYRACRWAPRWMWEAAGKTYIVTKQVGNTPPVEIDRFDGILDLSARYATGHWTNGIIYGLNGTLYRIHELVMGPHDTEHPLNLSEDPRLDPDELPDTHREMNILPE